MSAPPIAELYAELARDFDALAKPIIAAHGDPAQEDAARERPGLRRLRTRYFENLELLHAAERHQAEKDRLGVLRTAFVIDGALARRAW